jgi:hypothetical protein
MVLENPFEDWCGRQVVRSSSKIQKIEAVMMACEIEAVMAW